MKEICRLWKENDLVPKKKKDGTWTGLHFWYKSRNFV